MYKNIIFDAYGTLLDIHTNEQNDACWEKLAELLRFYDVNYTAKSLKDTYFSSCELQMAQGRKTHKHPEVDVVAVFNHILQNKGKKGNKSLATHLAQAFRAMTTEKLRLYDGVEETLSKLKRAGKKLYVLSNSQEVFLKPELQKLKIDRYFHGMVFSSQVGYSKPEPAIFDTRRHCWRQKRKAGLLVDPHQPNQGQKPEAPTKVRCGRRRLLQN